MNGTGARLYRWEDLPKEELKAGVRRRLVSTERMMVAHVYLDEGAVVPRHEHENEQLTYILEGVLRFRLGDDESELVDVHAGEILHIPSWLPHSAEAKVKPPTESRKIYLMPKRPASQPVSGIMIAAATM